MFLRLESLSKITAAGLGVFWALSTGCTPKEGASLRQDAGQAQDPDAGQAQDADASQAQDADAGQAQDAEASEAVELYFIRHAETEKNAKISDNENAFSPTGLRQIDNQEPPGLTQRLLAYNIDFDWILVSPKWRTQQTILPYLRRTGKKAIIWPELEECCWQEDQDAGVSSPEVRYASGKIKLEDVNHFSYREDGAARGWNNTTFGDGIRQLETGVDLLHTVFAHSGQKILLVGHYHAGGRILQRLMGIPIRNTITLTLSNAKMQHISQQSENDFFSFKLVEAER